MEIASTSMHSPIAQQVLEPSGWDMLSLDQALTSLERMPHLPSIENLVVILSKCRKQKIPAYAFRLLAYMRKSGLDAHRFLGNYLVPMLVEVGSMCDAQQVFDRLVDRNEHSWTSLITGYTESGELEHAFILYHKMQEDSVHPSGHTFVALLKACARLKDTERGQEIHAEIVRKGLLESDPFVGSTLVDMYAKCGLLAKAQEIFDKIPVQNAVLWNALIAGYAEHGFSQEALNCFKQMQLEGIFPDAITFVCSLKACGNIGAIEKGIEIHSQIAKKGLLETCPFVGNTLIDMYAKCGLLAKAQEVFDKLPVRDEVSWTALIAGYAEHDLGQEALNCFQQMQLEGLSPNAVTFVCSLKACGNIGAKEKGIEIHAEISTQGLLERNPFIGSTLVDMYATCGLLAEAQEVFNKLPVRVAVSWNALIAGYAERGLGQEALHCFEQMQLEGVTPGAITFDCSLKACGSIQAINKGREIHSHIAKTGLLESDPFIGSTLVDMYAKCGLLAKAQEVFDKLPVRDAVSWTALIAGYAEHSLGQDALNCFEQMQMEGVFPNSVTFVCSLKACSNIGAIEKGQEIHTQIVKREGLLEKDFFVGNTLVDMYAKCGLLAKAQTVFNKLPLRDAVSWTALITGYAEHGLGQEALECFEQMQLEGISSDLVSFICSLKACGNISAIEKGIEIHSEISKRGLLERDPFIGNTLVDMYAKCGLLAKAVEVFERLQVRDSVSWNALIVGYAEHRLGQEALDCFEQMQLEGAFPDVITFAGILKACGNIGAIDEGQEIHAQVSKSGLLESDPFIGNTVVDMYAKCGLLAKAQEVFDKLLVRDAVSWNALITGYAEHELGLEALNCFEQMQLEGIPPDAITFVGCLKVCGSIGAIDKGGELHAQIVKKGLLESDSFIANSLVDMYAKCGLLAKAQEVFDKLPVRDAVSWTVLIAGHAHLGESENVFLMLDRMRAEDIEPDGVTFLSILTACSHTGLVEKGQSYFEAMSKDYGITPTIEHLICIVDLLGRAGQLEKAVVMIKKMPCNPNLVLWHTLLGACRKWGNVELGRWAFDHAVKLDETDAATYILMSNIYADAHMQEDVKQVELMRLKGQAWKMPRQSAWTDDGGIVHSFLVGATRDSQSNCTYAKLENLSFKMMESRICTRLALAVPGGI